MNVVVLPTYGKCWGYCAQLAAPKLADYSSIVMQDSFSAGTHSMFQHTSAAEGDNLNLS